MINYMVAGVTGSWGNELVTQLLQRSETGRIVGISRNEYNQVMMERKFGLPKDKLKFLIGDVRDYDAVSYACRDIDVVYTLAALKHVPICEDQVQEAIKTNVTGTINVVNAAIKNGVRKVIDVSSDKSVLPTNSYGMTKALGEKITLQANQESKTKFVCVRGGNVMGSNGSVIPLFIDLIRSGKPLPITDFRMTRFFMTLREAINLLIHAEESSFGGELFVMNMPSCYVKDLAEVLCNYYGQSEMKEVGIRPGEKLDEVLISRHESPNTYEYDSNYFCVVPEYLKETYRHRKKVDFEEFNSKTKLMSKPEIGNMLEKGGFLSK